MPLGWRETKYNTTVHRPCFGTLHERKTKQNKMTNDHDDGMIDPGIRWGVIRVVPEAQRKDLSY